MRFRAVAAALAAVVVSGMAVAIAPAHAAGPVKVAVLDTGIFAGSAAFDAGQVADWKDFTPANGGSPYDDNGHGTLTASMVAGHLSGQTPSFAPGTKLAIGKVVDAAGNAFDSVLATGLDWAVSTAHADIISVSLGDSIPASGVIRKLSNALVHDALSRARAAGVLVVISNGNGLNNMGLPGLIGPLQAHGDSPYALAVGASGTDGFLNTAEPEVVAQYTVTGPSHTDPNGLITESGTSFSAPLVAGYAAHALAVARGNLHSFGANELEALVKGCARDTLLPPTFEGHGVIDAAQVACADANAAAGAVPAPNAVNGLWVESVSGLLRSLVG
jgi:hypothetical protein